MKKTSKPNYRKIADKVKKTGGLEKATYSQIEHVFKVLTVKYVKSLEDQLAEDKAHLLLKQKTIETLEEELRHKSNLVRRWVIHGYKSAKK